MQQDLNLFFARIRVVVAKNSEADKDVNLAMLCITMDMVLLYECLPSDDYTPNLFQEQKNVVAQRRMAEDASSMLEVLAVQRLGICTIYC